jgi:hypothetical protein
MGMIGECVNWNSPTGPILRNFKWTIPTLSRNRKFGRFNREVWRGFGDPIFHIAKTMAERIIGESEKRTINGAF